LKHDPEKCEAVFRKDHAQTKRSRNTKGPSRWLRPSWWRVLAGYLEHIAADESPARPEVGPHGPPAAATGVTEAAEAEVAVTVTEEAVVVMAEAAEMTEAVATEMAAAVTSRSWGDGSSSQSDGSDSCESDFTKHSSVLHL
jgi:hypothetical protein